MKLQEKIEDLLPKRAKEIYQLDEKYIKELHRTIDDTFDFFTKNKWKIPRLLQELRTMQEAYRGRRERLSRITKDDIDLPDNSKITSFDDNAPEPAPKQEAPPKEEFRFG